MASAATVIDVDSIPTWREYYQANKNRIDSPAIEPPLARLVKRFQSNLETKDPLEFEKEFANKISIWPGGDLTRLRAGAVVNAANTHLKAGGGICGAIFQAAGYDDLQEACNDIGKCPTGEARLTPGFKLPAEFIIHAVGPTEKDPQALLRTYESIYNVMKENGIRSIGVCCVSTGVYGFPNDLAAMVALLATREWLGENGNMQAVDRIVFSTFLKQDTLLYHALMPMAFPCLNQAKESAQEM